MSVRFRSGVPWQPLAQDRVEVEEEDENEDEGRGRNAHSALGSFIH